MLSRFVAARSACRPSPRAASRDQTDQRKAARRWSRSLGGSAPHAPAHGPLAQADVCRLPTEPCATALEEPRRAVVEGAGRQPARCTGRRPSRPPPALPPHTHSRGGPLEPAAPVGLQLGAPAVLRRLGGCRVCRPPLRGTKAICPARSARRTLLLRASQERAVFTFAALPVLAMLPCACVACSCLDSLRSHSLRLCAL